MRYPRSLRTRAGASFAVLLFLVLAGCGDGDDSPAVDAGSGGGATSTVAAAPGGPSPSTTSTLAGTVLSVNVRGGSVEGASRQRAPLNQPVTIRVTSDVAEEVHVHGYDETADVAPGRPAELTFVADIPGVFEVEFERSHKLLFTLEVR
ncbi:MAG TPA: hypothetical protein VHF91_06215 [Acidimicrobiales bacterium]|nr:hypothetical protein [Acidimicrobiales bacterium]